MRKIGQFADEFGLNPRTIRYYERIGLLPEPERTSSGYRLYSDIEGDRLDFILRAKSVGLSLDEIREILTLRDAGEQPCGHVLELVDEKLADIESQMRSLQRMRTELQSMKHSAGQIAECEGRVCRIIEGHTGS